MGQTRPAWLITGGTGQLGSAMVRQARADAAYWAPGRDMLDLSALPDDAALDALLAQHDVSVIINCGAYTAVDKAETESALAWAINADAPDRLARAAARRGALFVQISTDYVFDGSLPDGAYTEDQATAPTSVYGKSKLAGEQAVVQSGARYAILRTSWVVSATGSNFIKTMLRLGAERPELGVVADQFGRPTSADDLAFMVAAIASQMQARADQPSGIWHCSNSGETSWFGLAERVFARAEMHGQAAPKLNAITTAQYPTPAARPANSRLDLGKIGRDFGLFPRHWHDAVDDVVDELFRGQTAPRSE